MQEFTTSITRQTSLSPIVLAQPRQIADVFANEAEWRAALLQAPALLEQIVGAPAQSLEEEPSVAGYRPDLAFRAGGRDVLVELPLAALSMATRLEVASSLGLLRALGETPTPSAWGLARGA